MKRTLIAAAAILTVQFAFAQGSTKTPDAAQKALTKADAKVEKAEAAFASNPKKTVKSTVYLDQAKAYLDAYDAPCGDCWTLQTRTAMRLVPIGKPLSEKVVEIEGETYSVDVCEYADFYYVNDMLQIADITKPVAENALETALEACVKAYGVDDGSKTQDIQNYLSRIADDYYNEAVTKHNLGDETLASDLFLKAAGARGTEPLSVVDSISFYNAAVCSIASGDDARAIELYKHCLEIGYEMDGEVYSSIGRLLYKSDPDSEEAMSYLQTGLMKYPQSSCMGVLIDQLNQTDGSTDILFELLDKAISLEPTRGVFYYIKGNTYVRLKDYESAVAEYKKCIEIEPGYDFGYYGLGTGYATWSDAIMDEMNELPLNEYRKYDQLADQRLVILKSAVDPFEKVYEISADPSMRYVAAQYLKNIYYILQGSDSSYSDLYQKYDEIVKAGKEE